MGKIKVEGAVNLGVVSAKVQYVESNRDVVRRVLTFLEDRRVLGRDPGDLEDPEACRLSAMTIRDLMNAEILNVRHGGDVEASFKKIRRATRDFDTAAGKNSERFIEDVVFFSRALDAMRTTVIRECVFLAKNYDIELDATLVNALPREDLSFIPGFTNLGDLGHADPAGEMW